MAVLFNGPVSGEEPLGDAPGSNGIIDSSDCHGWPSVRPETTWNGSPQTTTTISSTDWNHATTCETKDA